MECLYIRLRRRDEMKASTISFLTMLIASSALLMVVPAIAFDYTLDIFGNANMDDTIDEDDIAYVEGIIEETNEETQLSDANYDGQIDEADIAQIELIIAGEEKELTIIDTANRTVTLTMPIQRIITITDDSAEALRILHAVDNIVGVSVDTLENEAYLPEFSQKENVGKWNEPDFEMILTLEPDLIISYKTATPKYLDPTLEGTGITSVALDLYRADDMREEMMLLGYIVDKKAEAEKYVELFNKVVDAVDEKVSQIPEESRTRVYLEGYSDLKTYTKGKGGDLACTMAGGVNIASDLEGSYPEVDSEWVMIQDPDVIVRLTTPSEIPCGYAVDDPSFFAAKRAEMMNRSGWDYITAVKDERAYMLLYEFGASPGVPVAIAYMAKWFYPDHFSELDPEELHREYLDLQGLDYDLSTRGVFAYPS
jgi:iron complex transport system substrate-binding protein